MATIKATCPVCGDVDLTPRQVTVDVVEAIDESQARRSYHFHCPTCDDTVRKPADAEVVRLLASAGVRVRRVAVPAEAREPHNGAPLGYDDLLDFALWLDGHDALAGLLEPARRS
jgi:hypothetical protein